MLQIMHQVQNLGYFLGTTCFDNKLLQYCSPKNLVLDYTSRSKNPRGGGGVLQISSDRDIEDFLGLKFSIP